MSCADLISNGDGDHSSFERHRIARCGSQYESSLGLAAPLDEQFEFGSWESHVVDIPHAAAKDDLSIGLDPQDGTIGRCGLEPTSSEMEQLNKFGPRPLNDCFSR